MDVWFVSGIDHNIMLRYEESDVKSRFTEFHFAVRGTNPIPKKIHLDGVRYGPLQNFYYITPNKPDPYHMKVVLEIGHIELYIDNVLVAEHNFPPELDNYDESAIFGLRAGSGIGSSETHFDNVRVYRIIDELDVPYFSQKNSDWNKLGYYYDSTNENIEYWGCALTSAAMLLKNHGLNYLPDSTPLNPLTLNNWLVEKSAYGNDGAIVFSTIADLSEEIVNNLPSGEEVSFDALENFRQDGLEIDYDVIDASISSELFPVIFKEKTLNSPSKFHFDVATGVIKSGEKYLIKDPANKNREVFEQPPDKLLSAIFLGPSNTNLSYITFQVDEEITINVESPSGKMATQNVNDIPMSHYTLEFPIGNYLYPEMSSGDPFWEFEYKYPETGKYKIELSSTEDGWFDLYSFIIDKEGGDNYKKRSVFISKDLPSIHHFDYNQESIDDFTFARHVDKATVISDIDALYRMGLIKRKGVARYLKRMTILYDRFSRWNSRVSRKFS
ncbi:MAG TPA: hypothetical protein ENL09_03785, partial [Bacteroidetes bacterium]|nr:hypothetical protein [Bacteroidota bacterium]